MAKRKDNSDQNDKEEFYDSHSDINELVSRENNEKLITRYIPKTEFEFHELAETHKSDQGYSDRGGSLLWCSRWKPCSD